MKIKFSEKANGSLELMAGEAVAFIITEHLQWSNSVDCLPSEGNLWNTQNEFKDTYLEAHYTPEQWGEELDDAKRAFVESEIAFYFKRAKREADKKWIAAMTLLGVEI